MTTLDNLHAWQKGMKLLAEIRKITDRFPRYEQYKLTSQLQRAIVSVLANIAEGFSRATSPDKAHKYTIARGECTEVYGLILIAIGLQYATNESTKEAIALTQEVGRLLTGLIKKFNSQPYP